MSDFEYSAYVGLDVHKDSIAVAIARPGRTGPEWQGTIPNHRSALRHLIRRLSPDGLVLSFCYEAGPCGYGITREITETGHHCVVVAPGLAPRGATDRIKTDRRDATMLAREHRSGSLTPVRVPDPEQEAMRDLTRAREDMKALQTKARHPPRCLPPPARPHLSGPQPLDTGPHALAGGPGLRQSGPADRLPGICRCRPGLVSGPRGYD